MMKPGGSREELPGFFMPSLTCAIAACRLAAIVDTLCAQVSYNVAK